MNQISDFQHNQPALNPYSNFVTRKRNQLFTIFRPFSLGLIAYELYQPNNEDLLDNLGAALITVGALFPTYLWCSGRAKGIPVFPILMLQYIWAYAFPIVTNHYRVIQYSIQEQFFASITTAIFLFLATFTWFQYVKKTPAPFLFYRGFSSGRKSSNILLTCLLISILFNVSFTGKWFESDSGIFSVVRIAVIAATSLAAFILSYQLGDNQLTKAQARLLIVLIPLFILTSIVSLLLVGAASVFFVATVGFIIGRRAIPLLPIAIMISLLTFLHAGKGEMRSKYWFELSYPPLQPWGYPAFLQEWSDYSLKHFIPSDDLSEPEDNESFFERSSMIQMLLLVQSRTPDQVPYLNGETYALIPQLLVPRILNPQKVGVHVGTHTLSIHYGLQSSEKITNTIAWGLLTESYANFGTLGCIGLAIVLGAMYGLVGRWTINAPIFSVQAFLSIVMLSVGIQTDASAGVFVSTLFQSVVILCFVSIFLMKSQQVQPSVYITQ
ncbi:MAG: hypothetical protein Kow00121_09270 [Elainellaceae cyanobacterium]